MNKLKTQFEKDCFSVEQAIDFIGADYSIKQLSEKTGLPTNRCYKCWCSLLKKNRIAPYNQLKLKNKKRRTQNDSAGI